MLCPCCCVLAVVQLAPPPHNTTSEAGHQPRVQNCIGLPPPCSPPSLLCTHRSSLARWAPSRTLACTMTASECGVARWVTETCLTCASPLCVACADPVAPPSCTPTPTTTPTAAALLAPRLSSLSAAPMRWPRSTATTTSRWTTRRCPLRWWSRRCRAARSRRCPQASSESLVCAPARAGKEGGGGACHSVSLSR